MIEDFYHLLPVSTSPVVHLELQISPRIFEKIWKGPNVIFFFFLYFTTGGHTSAATRAYRQIFKNFFFNNTVTNKVIKSQKLNIEDYLVLWRVGDPEEDTTATATPPPPSQATPCGRHRRRNRVRGDNLGPDIAGNACRHYPGPSPVADWYIQGLGGNWLMKKTRSQKSRDTVPLLFYGQGSLVMVCKFQARGRMLGFQILSSSTYVSMIFPVVWSVQVLPPPNMVSWPEK